MRATTSVGSERGQTLVLFTLFLTVLMGMSALVLDVGSWYVVHRQAQAAADASALAAARELPDDADAAQAAADDVADANGAAGEVSLDVDDTTATAETSTTAPAFFARLFDIESVPVRATAAARVGSYTAFSQGLAPFAIEQAMADDPARYATPFNVKVAGGAKFSPGNFGAVRLDVVSGPHTCDAVNGANDYEKTLAGDRTTCTLVPRDEEAGVSGTVIGPETGNMAGPTKDGLDDRVIAGQHVGNPFNPDAILATAPDGERVLTTFPHPNVLLLPIIDAYGAGGSARYEILGFAWFVVTRYDSSGVTGVLVRRAVLPGGLTCTTGSNAERACAVGEYRPDAATKVVELIG